MLQISPNRTEIYTKKNLAKPGQKTWLIFKGVHKGHLGVLIVFKWDDYLDIHLECPDSEFGALRSTTAPVSRLSSHIFDLASRCKLQNGADQPGRN